ncbi:MAG TPA: cytochrome c biogenesis protein CcsA [Patescibacteria group bacterium]|nr:cytochrome c biogenesis protein CcsA [Patescibacteria group bacterium]
MKGLSYTIALLVGLGLGFFPSMERPRPMWWKAIVIVLTSFVIIAALMPPLGGTFFEAALASQLEQNRPKLPVKAHVLKDTKHFDEVAQGWRVEMRDLGSTPMTEKVLFKTKTFPTELETADIAVINVEFDRASKTFTAQNIVATDPLLTIPFIPALSERTRNLYFHVPMAWVAVLAYLISMIYGILYLKKGDLVYDIKSSSAAALGTLFTILATLTGAIWAKFNWGSFWNWDPRQTSIFILMLIYGAYFALRSSIEGDERRARLSSVYSILAFVTVPFLIFILPRITEGLHPGAKGDENAGPLVSSSPDAINPLLSMIFSASLAAFTLIYFWLLGIQIRLKKVALRSSLAAHDE